MSDFYSETRSQNRAGISVYLVDDIGDGSIDRAKKLLAGISHGADKAIGSAIKRAAQSGETFASRIIREEYAVSAGTFNSYTKHKRHIITDGSGTTVDIEFKGVHIPLIKFDTTVSSSGRVSARVKRTSAKTAFESAFRADVGNHTGIFERKTEKRFPIEQKYGPSTPQMMSANDDVSQEIGDKIRDVFEERLDHEILRVLNGWGL